MATSPIHPAASAQFEQDGKYLKLKISFCRALYANVHEPRAARAASGNQGAKPAQYDCEFLLPKTAPGAQAFVEALRAFGAAAFNGQKVQYAVMQNADKEIKDLVEMGQAVPDALAMKAGHWVIKANTALDKPPQTRGIIYSGSYAGAIIAVAPYEAPDKSARGIKGYLNVVAFQADGERLGGQRVDIDAEFGPAPVQAGIPGGVTDDFGYGAQTVPPARQQATGPDDDLPF